jgi:cysteine desulfurase/selenocysteine lyase
VTGIENPVKEIRTILGDNAVIYLDMAQSAGHVPINLDALDVDFAGFSGHKMYGPQGVGGLFINRERGSEKYLTNNILGGGTVRVVGIGYEEAADSPERFEDGTKNLEGRVELGFAIDWMEKFMPLHRIHQRDKILGERLISGLKGIDGVRFMGLKILLEEIGMQ